MLKFIFLGLLLLMFISVIVSLIVRKLMLNYLLSNGWELVLLGANGLYHPRRYWKPSADNYTKYDLVHAYLIEAVAQKIADQKY